MATRVISKKKKRDVLGDTLGAIGQGLAGFAGGYAGRKQMGAAEGNAAANRAMMERMFGVGGQHIAALPSTTANEQTHLPFPQGGPLPGLGLDELLKGLRMPGMGLPGGHGGTGGY